MKIGARTFPPRSSSSKKEARDTAVQAALAILIEEEKESETGPTSQVHTHASFQSILHLIAHYRDSSLFSVCAFFLQMFGKVVKMGSEIELCLSFNPSHTHSSTRSSVIAHLQQVVVFVPSPPFLYQRPGSVLTACGETK